MCGSHDCFRSQGVAEKLWAWYRVFRKELTATINQARPYFVVHPVHDIVFFHSCTKAVFPKKVTKISNLNLQNNTFDEKTQKEGFFDELGVGADDKEGEIVAETARPEADEFGADLDHPSTCSNQCLALVSQFKSTKTPEGTA